MNLRSLASGVQAATLALNAVLDEIGEEEEDYRFVEAAARNTLTNVEW